MAPPNPEFGSANFSSSCRLSHSLFGAGEVNGVHFYAMQYIPGKDLEQLLRDVRRLRRLEDVPAEEAPTLNLDESTVQARAPAAPTASSSLDLGAGTADQYLVRIAQLGAQAADALAHAHALGVLHRDVKPSNLLLDGQGELWVTDFGLAKAEDHDDLTATGDVVGTLRYMAPERFGGRADARSDVYSLGVTLYELATLRSPFPGSDRAQLMRAVLETTPPPPRALDPRLPRDLDTIIQKAMAKEPGRRFATAGALADDLRRFLAGEPIVARPISKLEYALRKCQKHPALTAAVLAFVLLGVVSFTVIYRQWRATSAALAGEVTAHRTADEQRNRALAAQQTAQRAKVASDLSLYFNRVHLAHREWLAGNVGRAAELLDECPEELRHWEWRYVRRLCDADFMKLTPESDLVHCVAYSRDGRYLATASGPSQRPQSGPLTAVCLWDAGTGEKLWSDTSRLGLARSVAFSPDSRLLAVTSMAANTPSKPAAVFRPAPYQLLPPQPRAPRTLVVEVATRQRAFELEGEDRQASVVAFSPDGRYLATGSYDGQVCVYDARTGKRVFASPALGKNIFGIAFRPDGEHLAAVGADGTRIWSITAARKIVDLRPSGDTRGVSWSSDGALLATASWDGSVRIWNGTTYRQVFEYWQHASPVQAVAFAPDGRRIASADYLGLARIWDPASGRDYLTIRGHAGLVSALAFSPNSRRLVTGGDDRAVRVWDAMLTTQEALPVEPFNGGSHEVVFTSDGRYMALAGWRSRSDSREPRLRVYDKKTGGVRYFAAHAGPLCTVAVSPDDQALASGSDDRSIKLWDVASGQQLDQLAKAHDRDVRCVAFSKDGALLGSAGADKVVKVWDLRTRKELFALAHAAPLWRVAFSVDGKRLVSCGDKGVVAVWDANAGRALGELAGHQGEVRALALSPDGRWLASGGQDLVIRLWDMTAPARPELIRTLQGHTGRILSLHFSPDSLRLVSGSEDKTAKIWDVASGNEALSLRGDPNVVSAVAFTPDGSAVVACSNFVRVWDASVCTPETKAAIARMADQKALAWHEKEAAAAWNASPRDTFAWTFHTFHAWMGKAASFRPGTP
jgi:WD40 repeat protein